MAEFFFPLKEKREVAEGTMAFVFDASEGNFEFRAGQYIEIFLEEMKLPDERGNERHFSIASSPQDKEILMIATRIESPERPASGFKRTLKEMPLETKIKIKGPYGNFTLHENPSKKAVFLAGGIGITPCLSMIKDATERKISHKISLIYSNRNPQSTAFLKELKELEKANSNFKLYSIMTEKEGHVDENYLKKNLGDFSNTIFYTVGPPGFTQAMTRLLEKLGISRDEMRFEEFTGY